MNCDGVRMGRLPPSMSIGYLPMNVVGCGGGTVAGEVVEFFVSKSCSLVTRALTSLSYCSICTLYLSRAMSFALVHVSVTMCDIVHVLLHNIQGLIRL